MMRLPDYHDWFPNLPDDRRPAPRPRVAPDRHERRSWVVVFASLIAVSLIFGLGSCAGAASGRRDDTALEAVSREALAAGNRVAMEAGYADSLEASLTVTAQRADELAVQLQDERQRAEQYRLYAEEASSTIATLKQQKRVPEPIPAQAAQVTWTGNVEQWRSLAAAHFPADRVDQALLCISIETGGTGNPYAVSPSGKYVGLFQMDPGWGTYEQRTNPEYVMACAASSVAKNGSWKQWPPMVARGL